MRLAFLVADPGVPIGGRKGAAVHVEEIGRALRENGAEVLVLAARVERPLDGIETREVPLDADDAAVLDDAATPGSGDPPGARAELGAVLRDRAFGEAIASAHARGPLDGIYERQSLFSLAGLSSARRLGLPFAVEVNAPLPEEQARFRGLSLEGLAHAIERRLLRGADAVFCVSGYLRDRAVRLGATAERVVVLPNGVDPARFHPGVCGARVRERLDLGDAFVVGFFGSLKPWHGAEFLVEAFGRFLPSAPRARLLVAGEGPARARAEAIARDALPAGAARFLGWVPREEVPAHLAACDVVASPHPPIEPFYFSPLKILEAMAVGRPVLAADLPAIREIARDGETAALYRAADGEDFARRLERLARAEGERRALGERAAREVLARRTWRGNAAAVIEALARARVGVA